MFKKKHNVRLHFQVHQGRKREYPLCNVMQQPQKRLRGTQHKNSRLDCVLFPSGTLLKNDLHVIKFISNNSARTILTIYSSVILEKTIVVYLIKNFSPIYGPRSFITVFTNAYDSITSEPAYHSTTLHLFQYYPHIYACLATVILEKNEKYKLYELLLIYTCHVFFRLFRTDNTVTRRTWHRTDRFHQRMMIKGQKTSDIYGRMSLQYGDNDRSRRNVNEP